MAEARSASARRKRFSVDALFADTSRRAVGVADLVDAKQIQLDRIEPDPHQPRNAFDDESLAELAESIRLDGVLQPIAVSYDEARDVYVIIHGERRWRAARMAGLASIPAVVRDVPEERRLIQQLVENVVREDLNALDRAAALRALKAQMGDAPWEQVAAAAGIRRSRLFQLLSTDKLDASIQEALRRGVISEKQSRAVQGLPPEDQQLLAEALLGGEVSPREIDDLARKYRGASRRAASPRQPAAKVAGDVRKQAAALTATLTDLERSHATLSDADTEALIADLRTLEERVDSLLRALGDR